MFKLLTDNYNHVPLFWVDFNLNKFKKDGAKNSCDLQLHPEFRDDQHIIKTLNDLVDYIRDNYNMDKVSR
jgi:uncharacterized protein YeeX (DUF496 family)